MTENIMLQETEMTKTGFCERCDAQSDELKQCEDCEEWYCHECCADDLCDYCNYDEEDDDE